MFPLAHLVDQPPPATTSNCLRSLQRALHEPRGTEELQQPQWQESGTHRTSLSSICAQCTLPTLPTSCAGHLGMQRGHLTVQILALPSHDPPGSHSVALLSRLGMRVGQIPPKGNRPRIPFLLPEGSPQSAPSSGFLPAFSHPASVSLWVPHPAVKIQIG